MNYNLDNLVTLSFIDTEEIMNEIGKIQFFVAKWEKASWLDFMPLSLLSAI